MALSFASLPILAVPADDASAVLDRWATAYSANDPAAVTKLYAADAVLFGTAEPMIFDGSAPISAHYSGLPGSGNTVRICERRVLPPSREDAVLLTGSYPSPPMSAYGTTRTFRHVRCLAAFGGNPDVGASEPARLHPSPNERRAGEPPLSKERLSSGRPR